jgi:hypothetical protein
MPQQQLTEAQLERASKRIDELVKDAPYLKTASAMVDTLLMATGHDWAVMKAVASTMAKLILATEQANREIDEAVK